MNISAVTETNFTARSATLTARSELKQAKKQYADAFKNGSAADKEAAMQLLHEAESNLKKVLVARETIAKNTKTKEAAKTVAEEVKETALAVIKTTTEEAKETAKTVVETTAEAAKKGNKKTGAIIAATAIAAALAGGGIYLYNKNKDANNAA